MKQNYTSKISKYFDINKLTADNLNAVAKLFKIRNYRRKLTGYLIGLDSLHCIHPEIA